MNIPLKTLIAAVEAMDLSQKASMRALTHDEYMKLVKAWAALKVCVDDVIDAQQVEVTE